MSFLRQMQKSVVATNKKLPKHTMVPSHEEIAIPHLFACMYVCMDICVRACVCY